MLQGLNNGKIKFCLQVDAEKRPNERKSSSNIIAILLLDLCAGHGLAITNTVYEHKVAHKCTCYQVKGQCDWTLGEEMGRTVG